MPPPLRGTHADVPFSYRQIVRHRRHQAGMAPGFGVSSSVRMRSTDAEETHMRPRHRLMSLTLLLASAAFATSAHARSDEAFMKAAAHAGDNDKFDERYARNFGVKAHEDTIKLFEEASRDAKDPEVRAWAGKTLPGLKHHLEMAKALPAAAAKP